MSKHKKAGDERGEAGKAGSAPSGTENERAREDRRVTEERVPKIPKEDVGEGKPLH